MSFDGPKFEKSGNLSGQATSQDAVMAMALGGVAATGLALGVVKKLIQLSDAEDLGINAAYDANNSILVHHHIEAFFEHSPNGTLFIMLVPQGTSLTDMCDKDNNHLKKLILDSVTNREAKSFGVVLNPDMSTYAPTITNGIDADAISAVTKAQALVDSLASDSIFVDSILIEGRQASAPIAALEDTRTLNSENVSIVIANDPYIAALDPDYANYAAVGDALGMLSIRKVHESLGSVDIIEKPEGYESEESYSLTNVSKNKWEDAAISGGTLVSSLSSTDLTALSAKGYIYAGSYEGFAGVYFNGSSTCMPSTETYSRIERNRVWNKCARYVRAALIPKIRSTVDVNKDTGFIAPTTIASWERSAQKKANKMLIDDEVSGLTISIDPKQDVLSGNPIVVKIDLVPKGHADAIVNKINLTNPFNA